MAFILSVYWTWSIFPSSTTLSTLLLDIQSMTSSWEMPCLLRELSVSSIRRDTSFKPFILKQKTINEKLFFADFSV